MNKLDDLCQKALEGSLYVLIIAFPFSKALVEIFVVVALIAWIFQGWLRYSKGEGIPLIPKTPLDKPLLIFFIANLISTIFSIYQPLSIRALFSKVAECLFIYWIAFQISQSPNGFKRLSYVVLVSSLLLICNAFFQYFTGADFIRHYTFDPNQGIKASFISTNTFGCALLLLVFFLLRFLNQKKSFKR